MAAEGPTMQAPPRPLTGAEGAGRAERQGVPNYSYGGVFFTISRSIHLRRCHATEFSIVSVLSNDR